MNEAYVIGLDVGGTRIKSGAVSRNGTLTDTGLAPSGFAMKPESLLECLACEIQRITTARGRKPEAVTLGFPGAVDPNRGVVLLPGKLQIERFPIVPLLRERTGLKVTADNDGRLSILAEVHYGQARMYKWAVTITLGTGVGSGVMLDGQILRDPHLQFGTQASHIIQEAHSDRLCITRARGTANILCSATALAMAVRDGLYRGLPSVLSDDWFEDPHKIDFEAVLWGVDQGDRLCLDALGRWTYHLGCFLSSVVHMYSPEIIILSGGATHGARHFLEPVREHVNQHTFHWPPDKNIPIVLTELGEHANVLGAASLAWKLADRF